MTPKTGVVKNLSILLSDGIEQSSKLLNFVCRNLYRLGNVCIRFSIHDVSANFFSLCVSKGFSFCMN